MSSTSSRSPQCDTAIEALLATLAAAAAAALRPRCRPPPQASRVQARSPPSTSARPLHRLTGGADLSQIDGIGPHAALQLVAEIGTDMRRWPTEKHFTSWLTLAPNNKVSGGRLLSSRTPPSANRAAAILRRCRNESRSHLRPRLAPSTAASPPAPARPRRLPPPPASSPCWSTASCPATSSITTPAQPLTTSSTAPVNSSRCANAPNYLATNWSITPPARYSSTPVS